MLGQHIGRHGCGAGQEDQGHETLVARQPEPSGQEEARGGSDADLDRRGDCGRKDPPSQRRRDQRPAHAQQRYGRGVRQAEGKAELIHFDVADAGNRFARNAESRRAAFQALGVPVVDQVWEGDAAALYDAALDKLGAGYDT